MATSTKKRQSRNIIGDRIREARQLFDPPLTQDQLAGRLAKEGIQLDRVALAKVENGLRCAFDFEVKALAAVLKVDANWLLGIGGRTQTARKAK
jgi:HTH-type transcriptional regulator, cell division transcriptional repressor